MGFWALALSFVINLRLAGVAFGRLEEQVVIALAIKRRIEIDQIDTFVCEVLPQHIQIIAEEQRVSGEGRRGHTASIDELETRVKQNGGGAGMTLPQNSAAGI
jgi:hypothetical protein